MTHTLDILEKLISFDTVSQNSNLELVAYAEDFLTERGFALQRLTNPLGDKMGLYAQKGPAGDGVLLSGHTDVVPVEGQNWTKPPFKLTIDGHRAYGRGTTDMKGFVASMLALADRSTRVKLREPLKLVLSYDEEVGCVGVQQMLDRLAPMLGQPRACIVGEPTMMQVAVGHKGKAALRAVCDGQIGHSALAPQFTNALYLATDFISELRNIQHGFAHGGQIDHAYTIPYTTIHVGMMSGGRALNIVPDRAELTFEYRHLATDRGKDILSAIEAAATRVSEKYRDLWPDARINVEQYNAYPGLDVSQNASIVGFAQKMADNNKTIKVAFGTEAGFFSELGIPTIVCGPGSMDAQGHKPDEYIEIEQLTLCDAMMDRILDDLAY